MNHPPLATSPIGAARKCSHQRGGRLASYPTTGRVHPSRSLVHHRARLRGGLLARRCRLWGGGVAGNRKSLITTLISERKGAHFMATLIVDDVSICYETHGRGEPLPRAHRTPSQTQSPGMLERTERVVAKVDAFQIRRALAPIA
jgi:hypothetical protein